MGELVGTLLEGDDGLLRHYERSLRSRFIEELEIALSGYDERIVEEVKAAKARHSLSSPSSSTPSILSHPRLAQEASTEAAGNFTEEVVGILHKAFETKATLTRAEVKSLSAVTQLNTKQVSIPYVLSRCRRR